MITATSTPLGTSLKPYPEYKDSGLPWLGQVPGHWEAAPGFAAFREKQVKNVGLQEKRVLSLSYGRIIVKPEGLRGLMPDSFETYQIVDPGDIIIRSTDLQNDKTSLRIGMVRDRGIITSAYICMKTTEALLPEFGYQLLNTYDLCKVIYGMGSGLRQNLAWSDFKRMPLFLPSLDEQAAIVRFLDHATQRLDKAIRAKRKTIALLNEQKQAIIHRAVTRGLAPDAPLKDSGILWLGDIPQHWEVLPLKRCSIVISKGTTPSTEGREILEEGPIRFIKAESISGGIIIDKPRAFIDQETHNVLRRSQLREHDVLFVIAGATLGKIAIVHESHLPANTNQAVAFIRPNRRVTSEFLAIWLQSSRIKEQIWLNAVQSAQPNLSMGSLGDFSVPLPSIAEQAIVVERLNAELRLPNAAIQRIEREIELLREYRTRLIADVVTGKLDVREAAACLPEMVEAPAIEPELVEIEETSDELLEVNE